MIILGSLAALGVPQVRNRFVAPSRKSHDSGPGRVRIGQALSGADRSLRVLRGPAEARGLTKEELYERAQKADVSGRSEMSKEQLVEALRQGPSSR